jgi:hypothetical protein
MIGHESEIVKFGKMLGGIALSWASYFFPKLVMQIQSVDIFDAWSASIFSAFGSLLGLVLTAIKAWELFLDFRERRKRKRIQHRIDIEKLEKELKELNNSE